MIQIVFCIVLYGWGSLDVPPGETICLAWGTLLPGWPRREGALLETFFSMYKVGRGNE